MIARSISNGKYLALERYRLLDLRLYAQRSVKFRCELKPRSLKYAIFLNGQVVENLAARQKAP